MLTSLPYCAEQKSCCSTGHMLHWKWWQTVPWFQYISSCEYTICLEKYTCFYKPLPINVFRMSIPSYIQYICKTETHANGIISIMQPLWFICSVINCLTAVEGTDVLETSLYLNSINCLLVTRTFINAFFPRGDAFVMKFANILFVKYFYLFTHVAYLYTILKKKTVFHW